MKTQSAYVGFFHNPDYALLFTRLADVTVVKMRNGSLTFKVETFTNDPTLKGKEKTVYYRDLSIARMQAKKRFGSETVFISD